MSPTAITRRTFLKSTGSIAVAFTFLPDAIGSLATAAAAGPPGPPELRVRPGNTPQVPYAETVSWLIMRPSGITIHTGRVELGTGVRTAMTQIALEELHLDAANVTYIQGDTRRTIDEGFTAGSKSIQNGGPLLRRAAATAFQELLTRAAAALEVSPADLQAANGKFGVIGSNKQVTYQKLLEKDSAVLLSFPGTSPAPPPVKSPDDYVLVGTPLPRADLPDKLFCQFGYVQDIVLPDMLHGRVIRPAGRNATFNGYVPGTLELAQAIPGFVAVIQIGNFVGVVAETEWAAITASRNPTGLRVNWAPGQQLVSKDSLPAALKDPVHIYGINEEVPAPAGMDDAYASAEIKIEAEYFTPFQMHGGFSPSCAVADVRAAPDPETGVQATVWSQTQGVYPLRRALADLLGVTEPAVHVIYEEGAGCYGHNGADDVAGDASLMSMVVGRPVRVHWSRQDEHGWEPLGPAMVHTMRGAVNGGQIVAWDHTVHTPPHNSRPNGLNAGALIAGVLVGDRSRLGRPASPILPNQLGAATGTNSSTRNAPLTYSFPNRLTHKAVKSFETTGAAQRVPAAPLQWRFLRSTALRSLGGFSNSFANESMLGELAAAAGLDDLEVRLQWLQHDPRAYEVVEALTEAWTARPQGLYGTGAGLGYQQYENENAYAAAYVELTVDTTTGVIRVHRAVVSHDCGLIINPDGLANQIEGNVMQGVSRTLKEEVQFSGNGVTSNVWEMNPPFVVTPQYPVIRFNETPSVETILIDRPHEPAWGAGEPVIGTIGGAIGNAVYHAVGIRLRSLPMLPTKVLAALAAT